MSSMSNHTGEAIKHPTVTQKYGAPPEAMIPAKRPSCVMVCKHHDGEWATATLFDHSCACDAGRGVRASML